MSDLLRHPSDNVRRAYADVLRLPERDDLRCVLADALGDVGETDRCEFIKVQCELASHGDPIKTPKTCELLPQNTCTGRNGLADKNNPIKWCKACKPIASLLERELVLFRQHGAEWFGDPLGGEVGEKCKRKHRNSNAHPSECACHGSGHIVTDCTVRVPVVRNFGNRMEQSNFIVYTIRRGFPDEVACTMEQFVGRECGHCRGQGYHDYADPEDHRPNFSDSLPCSYCHNGHVGGIVDWIAARWPVTGVTLTDREPRLSQSDVWYFIAGANSNEEHWLPQPLFDGMAPFPVNDQQRRGTDYRGFRTEANAFSALSAACCRLARERAEKLREVAA